MQEQFKIFDLGPESIELYRCDGQVLSIRDFSANNLSVLSTHEADFLKKHIGLLPSPDEIPENFQYCLSRSRDLASVPDPVLIAQRSGARSAFMPEDNLQLKGCRPVLGGEEFPTESLPFGSTQIVRERIPFGVMTVEAALREVLGFCFMQIHGLPMQATPLAVTAFCHRNKLMGYGMLLRVNSEDRVESHIEDPHCKVRDVITMQAHSSQSSSDSVIGSELRLKGVNLWKYTEAKGRILAAMNWHGGFRGILNSNFGNDVLSSDGDDNHKLVIADFDTFRMVPVPTGSSIDPLDPFVLQCLVEVAIGSLPILQYVDLPPGSSHERIADALGAIYFKKSSLWRSYFRHFLSEADARGISMTAVVEAIGRMRRTEAFSDILGYRILTGDSVKRAGLERVFHYSHN